MKKIWFKRKKYGWGWYPATWQGWLCIAVYVLTVLFVNRIFEQGSYEKNQNLKFYLFTVFLATMTLIFISYKKGEKPKWQWGNNKSQD